MADGTLSWHGSAVRIDDCVCVQLLLAGGAQRGEVLVVHVAEADPLLLHLVAQVLVAAHGRRERIVGLAHLNRTHTHTRTRQKTTKTHERCDVCLGV